MEEDLLHIVCLVVWSIVFLLVMARCFRRDVSSVGLPIAFLGVLSLEHWFGALIYTFPWYEGFAFEKGTVMLGFRYSTIAICAFGLGNLIIAPFIMRSFRLKWMMGSPHVPDTRLPLVYIFSGILFYFALDPILSDIPSIRTLVHAGWNLIVIGLCLGCWNFWRLGKRRAFFWWLAVIALAPLFTMFSTGFLGIGIISLIIAVSFISVFYRPKWKLFLSGIVISCLALSFFVSYMEYREELRDVVWGGKEISKRTDITKQMMGSLTLLDVMDNKQLGHIDVRLNQSHITGSAISNMQMGHTAFARGETVADSLVAMVPRILWPAKPIQIDRTRVVEKYTGLYFEDVGVAMGLIMEFYINLGLAGVIIGFVLFGIILAIVDTACGYRLMKGDWQGFTYWFLPSLSLVGCVSLVQITMTAVSSVVFCYVINKFVLQYVGIGRIRR